MVAIVGGNRLGLNLGSISSLGQQRGLVGTPTQGRSGERAYVNVATGDLVLQDLDASLSGVGPDTLTLRTYNSQAGWGYDVDTGDGWQITPRKYVRNLGAHTLRRYDVDGAACDYLWNEERGLFVATLSAGSALDTIRANADHSYTWIDGATGAEETYQGGGWGLITSSRDTSGNTIHYEYDNHGLINRVLHGNGERVEYTWGGVGNQDLLEVRTVLASGETLRQVSYTYDGQNRLETVSVDLDPEHRLPPGSEALARYTTTYGYHGNSNRVAKVFQSDGTSLAFTYVFADDHNWRIATVTDGLGEVTSFAYDVASRTTTVTDPLGVSTVYRYDAEGQLTEIRSGVTASSPGGLAQLRYTYNAIGDVDTITDGLGRTVRMQYDANGNLTSQVDSEGNTLKRTYDAQNQLLTETVYAKAASPGTAPGQPQTTRYVYDASGKNLLRFVISPEGRVTEHRYDSRGQRTSTLQYPAAAYDASALPPEGVPGESQMSAWVGTQDLALIKRQDMSYDFRGELRTLTTYANVDVNGVGIAQGASTTEFVYDHRGLLLQTVTPDRRGITQSIYDGLGRVVSTVSTAGDGSLEPVTTVTQYDDANGKTTVTLANGLATTSAFDRAGRLVSVMQSSASSFNLGTTRYFHDEDGRLLMTEDPTGQRRWFLYDAAGRKVADVDAAGGLTEYVYDGNGRVTQVIAYDTAIDTRRLVDGQGRPTTGSNANPQAPNAVTLASLRPAATELDRRSWNLYDQAGRLAWEVDALGYVTRTEYDGSSRIVAVTKLASPIDTTKLGNGIGVELAIGGFATTTQLAATSGGTGPDDRRVLTATVTSRGPSGAVPTGTVTFFAGQTLLGSAVLEAGVAVLGVTNAAVGGRVVTAVYGGDAQHVGSVSGAGASAGGGSTAAAALATTTTLSVARSSDGSSFRLSAAVAGRNPGGNVIFYSGGVPVGSAVVVDGVATLEVVSLPVGSNRLTAVYLGDADNATSTSQAVIETITVASIGTVETTTTLHVSRTSAAPGAPVILTAAIAGANPGGTVTFFAGATSLGTANVASGLATIVVSDLPVGADVLSAAYSGDAANAASTSATIVERVLAPSATALALTTSAPGSLTFTAAVTGSSPGGTVSFFDGATLVGSAAVMGGVASLSVNGHTPSGDGFVAVYSGDLGNTSSASAATSQVSVVAPIATTLTSSSARTAYGAPVTLTAGVSGAAGGVISFYDGASLLGSVPVGAGAATLTLSGLPVGTDRLIAIYTDVYGRVASTSNVLSQVVVASPTTTTVTTSAPSVVQGAPVTFTASVAGANGNLPTGTITFFSGTSVLGTAALADGRASLTVSDLPGGVDAISVGYSGDAHNATSVAWLSQAVAAAPTSLRVTSSAAAVAQGAPVILTARVSGTGSAVPTGAVTFRAGATVLGTATLTEGFAALTVTGLPAGTSAITAAYSGDASNAACSSEPLSQLVDAMPRPTTTSLASSATAVVGSGKVTLTARVTGSAPGGVVTFLDGQTAVGTAAVVNGVATLTTRLASTTTANLVATYSGDAANATSVSGVVSIDCTRSNSPTSTPPPGTTTELTLSSAATSRGTPVTATALVGGGTPGTPPTGTVSFFAGARLLGSAAVVNGRATLALADLAVGDNAIRAVYSGDARSASSTSSAVTETVTLAASATALFTSRSEVLAGGRLTLVAQVSGALPGGTVTFYAGAEALGSAAVVNGLATLTVSDLTEGTAVLTAEYVGDANNAASTSAATTITVAPAPSATATAVTGTRSSAAAGSGVTLHATVSGSAAGGTLSFFSGATLLGSAAVSGGAATLVLPALPAGADVLVGVYSGDARNAGSTVLLALADLPVAPDAPVDPGSGAAPGTTVLVPTTLTSLSGTSIPRDGALSVRVTGADPTGVVTFFHGTTVLGTAAVVNGVATLRGAELPVGLVTFGATYSGDAANATSVLSFPITVTPAATTTTLVASRDGDIARSGVLLLTARVTGSDPTGTVTFYNGTTALGTATLSNGIGAITIVAHPAEIGSLTAVYSGDTNNATSASAPLIQSNGAKPVEVALAISAEVPGGPLTLTATVVGHKPSGLVTFVCGTTVLGSATLVERSPSPSTSVAILTADRSALPPGSDPIVAVYAGDSKNGGAVSAGVLRPATAASTIVVGRDADDRVGTRIYDRDGRLRATIDEEGHLVETRYDAAGQQTETIAYARKVAGFVDAASIAARVAAARAADSLAGLLPDADERDIRTFSYFNARGQKIGEVDGERYLTEFSYDVNGRLDGTLRYARRIEVPVTTTSKVPALRPAASREDRRTASSFDALGRLSTSSNAEGTVTRYSYDRVGNLVETVLALDTSDKRTLTARYDVQGRVTAELSPEGAALLAGLQTPAEIDAIWDAYATTYAYDAAGRRTSSTDANHNRTVFFYDDTGRLRFTVNAMGEVMENRYDALGHLVAKTQYATRVPSDAVGALVGGVLSSVENHSAAEAFHAARNAAPALNSTTSFGYDARGVLLRTEDAEGAVTTSRFDAFGQLVRSTRSIDATRTVTRVTSFDRRGLQTGSVSDAGGGGHVNATTATEHDAFGRVVRTVDPNGNTTKQSFDRLGRMVQVIDPTNVARSSTYDAFGRVLTIKDGLENETRYAYDDVERSVKVTTPEGVEIATVHDRHGQTISVTTRGPDGDERTTTYGYDANGNLRETRTQLEGSDAVRTLNEYDHAKRLEWTTDGNKTKVHFLYDAANRLTTRIVDPDGLALVTKFEYDAKGNQFLITDPNDVVTKLDYDRKGQVLTQTVDHGDGRLNLVTKYSWDDLGRQLTVEVVGGTKSRYVYDALGRRTQTIADPDGLALTEAYEYDDAGNVVRKEDGAHGVTRYVYDGNNRLVATVDAEGGVSKSEYDRNGNLVRRTTYARRIALGDWTDHGKAPAVAADPQHDLDIRIVYDKDNRAIFTIDGTGSVVAMKYDGAGNVVERQAYATTISPATERTAEAIRTAVEAVADAQRDARVRRVYDAANRLVWSVDGTGAVTRQVYDGNGNIVKTIAYAERIGAGAAPGSVPTSAADRVAVKAYDAANRLRFEVDALGGVLERVHDRDGNVVQRVAYAQRVAAPTVDAQAPSEAVLAAEILGLADTGRDRTSWCVFDRANRLEWTVDAGGSVTRNHYDAASRAIAITTHGAPVAISSLPRHATSRDVQAALATAIPPGIALRVDVDAAGRDVLHASASADRTVLRAYDGAGRMTHAVDALGYVTENTYDGAGRVKTTTLFAERTTGLAIGATADEIADAVTRDASVDQKDAFAYDGAGNLVVSTDALNQSETWRYDGAGSKVEFRNKNLARWTYDYDAAGRLLSETSPEVTLTTVKRDASGRLVTDTTVDAPVVTRMTYDGLGNLTSRVEAWGRPEQRTTTYRYDALGRQVRTEHPDVAVYDANLDDLASNGATAIAERTETTRTLWTETFYDSFGDAVANVDVSGNTSYKAYDKLGRVRFEFDALGHVTGYGRNTFGDAETLTRYADAPTLAGSPTDAPSESEIADTLAPLPHGADRTITTAYDRLGRTVRVTQPEVWVHDGDGRSYRAASVVKHTYDAFGQRVLTEALAEQGPDVWARTTFYFDPRGQAAATVDALGHVTTQRFDAAGNILQFREYATPAAAWSPTSLSLPERVAEDRTVVSEYDQLNRKTKDTKVDVEFSVASDGTSTRGNVSLEYGYDAVGNLTRTTQRGGGILATSYTYYDALGRTKAVAAPPRSSTVGGGTVIPLVEFARDAHGNVVVKTEHATGTASATELGYAPVAPSDADRRTLTAYDALGHMKQTTDAEHHSTFASHDAAGRVAKQWQGVTTDDGTLDGAFVHTRFTVLRYDALGREMEIVTPASTSVVEGDGIVVKAQQDVGVVTTSVEYNAFGEVSRRSSSGTATPTEAEWFEYDAAGRVWRTNSGDGNVKVALYDLLGRQTAQITSAGSVDTGGPGVALGGAGITSAEQVDGMDPALLRRTDSKLDLLGRVVRQTLPARRDGDVAAYRPVIHQTFDRWGNVLSQSDARNAAWVTSYRYNANDQVIEQEQPLVSVIGDHLGEYSEVRPTSYMFYDALGRQVAVRDANGNVNGQTVDAAGQLVSELHADGGEVNYAYDALGNRVRMEDARHHITEYGFDLLGRNTTITSEVVGVHTSDASYAIASESRRITTVKEYDEAGQVVKETNGKGEETRHTWDLRGNRVGTRLPIVVADRITRSAYDANARQIGSQDGNGNLTTWTYDAFGLLVAHRDFQIGIAPGSLLVQPRVGYVESAFVYDNARQLVSQGNDRGKFFTGAEATSQNKNLQYTYDAAGQLVKIRDNAVDQTSRFAYNAIGKKVWEQTVQGGATDVPLAPVYQDQILGYDALGRLAYVKGDPDKPVQPGKAVDGVVVRYDYDAAGNRKHQDVNFYIQRVTTVHYTVSVPVPTGETDPVTGEPIYTYVDEERTRLDYATEEKHEHLWFAYDEMNRQVLVDGAVNGVKGDRANLVAGQGHILEYDANGNRTSDEYWGRRVASWVTGKWYVPSGDEFGTLVPASADDPNRPAQDGAADGDTHTYTPSDPNLPPTTYTWRFDPLNWDVQDGYVKEHYDYDKLDRLEKVAIDRYGLGFQVVEPEGVTLERRWYDGASRVVKAGPDGAVSKEYIDKLTGGLTNAVSEKTRISVYDDNGRLARQRALKPGGEVDSDTEYTATQPWAWYEPSLVQAVDAAGNPRFDDDNNPIYVQRTDGTGAIQTDQNGNPILVQARQNDGTQKVDADGTPLFVRALNPDGTPAVDSFGNPIFEPLRNDDGTPIVDDAGNPVMVPLKDGTGKALFDAAGNPLYVQRTDGTGAVQTDSSGNPILVEARLPGTQKVDAAGNPLFVRALDANGNPAVDSSGNPVYEPLLNDDGDLILDVDGNPTFVPLTDGTGKKVFRSFTVDGGYDGAGNVKAYRTISQEITSYYHFSQLNYDGYREGTVSGYRSDNQDHPGRTISRYDANGFLVSVSDTTKSANDRSFVNDSSGHILMKRQVSGDDIHVLRQLVVDGNVIAVYGSGTDPKKPATDEGDPRFDRNQGNFDLNYQPITNSYPAPSAGQYSVRGGDTLQTIALSAYGDSALWYRIANANGLRGNEDLRIGQTLTIPTLVTGARNAADTFKPYDPSKVVGDTTPNLPVPQSDDGGCGVLQIILTIVIVVVAVVVTVYTAGAASAALAPTLGSLGGAIVGGAVGGAVGSIVSQGLSMAVGLQEDFSWSQVALGAIGGAVGAGVGEAFKAVGLAGDLGTLGNWAVAGAKAAISNAATQGIAVMTGLQEDFSWRDVAASAVGAVAGAAVEQLASTAVSFLPEGYDLAKRVAVDTLSGIASSVAATVTRRGRIDVLQIATDAFGNALGNAVASAMTAPAGQQDARRKRAEEEAQAQPSEQEPTQPELRNDQGEKPVAGDEQLGENANPEADAEPRRTSAQAKRGQGPLAVAANIDPDNPYAVLAYLAAMGQIKYDPTTNRWDTVAGQTYTADLSALSNEQMAQLDAAGRRIVSAEAKVDQVRAAYAQAQAEAQAQRQAAAAQGTAQQTTAPQPPATSEAPLPPLSPRDNSLHVPEGYVYQQYSAAMREANNPDNPLWQRAISLGLATAAAPLAWAEEYVARPLLNVPDTMLNAGTQIGERAARASILMERGEYGDATVEILHAIQSSSEGISAGLSWGIPLAGAIESRVAANTAATVEREAAANAERQAAANAERQAAATAERQSAATAERQAAANAERNAAATVERKLATTWQEHEAAVTQRLKAANPEALVGEQVTLDVTNKTTGVVKRIRIDNTVPTGPNTYQLVDAKFSSVKDLTTSNLENTFTKNQTQVYNWVAKGENITVTPVGQKALEAGMKPGIPIKIEPSIQIHVNGPTGIVVRTFP